MGMIGPALRSVGIPPPAVRPFSVLSAGDYGFRDNDDQ
jgi:hypothetical protein